jgi:hypothetical protein
MPNGLRRNNNGERTFEQNEKKALLIAQPRYFAPVALVGDGKFTSKSANL